MSELTDDPTAKVEDLVKVGDEVEAIVIRVSDRDCLVKLSKRRLDVDKHWEEIEAARENETVLEGVVTEDNKGGVVVSVKGVRVFVPASQTGLPRETPMSTLVKQKVRLVITEVNRARRRVVGSISRVSRAERAAAAEKVWAEIEEGKHYTGTVKSLTSYGAFRGHRRRGRHGPHLRAVLEPHQAPLRGGEGGRHRGRVRHLLRHRRRRRSPWA